MRKGSIKDVGVLLLIFICLFAFISMTMDANRKMTIEDGLVMQANLAIELIERGEFRKAIMIKDDLVRQQGEFKLESNFGNKKRVARFNQLIRLNGGLIHKVKMTYHKAEQKLKSQNQP